MKLVVYLSAAFRIATAQNMTIAPSVPLDPNVTAAPSLILSTSNPTDALTSERPSVPVPPDPTISPSLSTSSSPTVSPALPVNLPTLPPSASPTSSNEPTISLLPTTRPPTGSPTISTSPTSSPTLPPTESPTLSARPTVSGRPSLTPTNFPTYRPSTTPTYAAPEDVRAIYDQRLLIGQNEIFNEGYQELFEFLYESYTSFFGYNVSSPQILAVCEITKQAISENPANISSFQPGARRSQDLVHILTVTFTMEYSTRSPLYDISNYNALFRDYINQNTTKVAQDMKALTLPVVAVLDAIMFSIPDGPEPSKSPSLSPTVSTTPTYAPTSYPSGVPSEAPTAYVPSIDVVSTSFALGISLGIAGACVIVLLAYMYRQHLEKSDNISNVAKVPDAVDAEIEMVDLQMSEAPTNNDQPTAQDIKMGTMGTLQTEEVSALTHDVESAVRLDINESQRTTSERSANFSNKNVYSHQSSSSYGHFLAEGLSIRKSTEGVSVRKSDMFPGGKNSEMIHNASFSSSNGSYDEGVQQADSFNEPFHPSIFDGSMDELDNYKNQNIEVFRTAVEEAVHDVEGMMMLAVTNALTQPPTSLNDNQDHNALEAESLYQTFDWLKRNEQSPVESRREYFQELLNRIVNLVFYAMIPPIQGSQIVHGCATIIGLPLVKDLPKTTIIVQGMLKTNDLAMGQRCIKRAFNSFGQIEAASIAPNNHGFGFVRFVQANSVQKALGEYRDNEIVIQDVAVSVKILK